MPGKRQLGVLGLAALVAFSTSAVGAGAPGPQAGKPDKQKKASKLAYIIEDVAANVARERGAGRSATRASNAAVRATADGSIEVAIWSKEPIGGRERADLAKLGAAPTASFSRGAQKGKPAVGVVQAVVPAERLEDVAALDWVGAVTPVDYGEADNHPTNPNNSEGVALHHADAPRPVASTARASTWASSRTAWKTWPPRRGTSWSRVTVLHRRWRRGHGDARDRPRHGAWRRPVLHGTGAERVGMWRR